MASFWWVSTRRSERGNALHSRTKPAASSGVVEPAVLAVGGVTRGAAAEVARGPDLVVALLAQQLDEPGLVLDLLVEDARRHVVGARVLAEGQVAHLAPGADGAALRLQQHRQDLGRRRVGRQVGVGAAGPVGELADVARDRAAQPVDAG